MATAVQFSPSFSAEHIRTARLTRKERDLLRFLRQNAGRCLSRDMLLRQVWGYREGVKSRTLDVHVQRLRKKLGPDEGSKILTVFRGGYLWSAGNGGAKVTAEPEPPGQADLAENSSSRE